MKKNYILTKGAQADLREIVRYTIEQWGKEKCINYIKAIEDKAEDIACGHGYYKNMSFIIEGLRVGKSGKHYIFCLAQNEAPFIILAILHERMDFLEKLKSRFEA